MAGVGSDLIGQSPLRLRTPRPLKALLYCLRHSLGFGFSGETRQGRCQFLGRRIANIKRHHDPSNFMCSTVTELYHSESASSRVLIIHQCPPPRSPGFGTLSHRPALGKVARPRLPRTFARERLHTLLDQASDRPLTWIVGPPGAGKTTLMASYLESARATHLVACGCRRFRSGDVLSFSERGRRAFRRQHQS